MNRFRKILSAALAGCMAVSALMMSAGAANTGTEAAREKAIYGSQAWTVNGAAAIQHSDGTVEPVPEFSALYPGWTVPKQAASVSSTTLAEVADVGSHSISGYYRNVYLTQDVKYKPFYSFLGNGETVSAFAVTIPGRKIQSGHLQRDSAAGRRLAAESLRAIAYCCRPQMVYTARFAQAYR